MSTISNLMRLFNLQPPEQEEDPVEVSIEQLIEQFNTLGKQGKSEEELKREEELRRLQEMLEELQGLQGEA